MAHVKIENAVKNLTFNKWCKENRWTDPKLSFEFQKYGAKVSITTIWNWRKGIYSPRDQNVQKILSKIVGFDWRKFSNFQKNTVQ